MRCGSCNKENRAQARWCGNCGAALASGSSASPDDSLGARVGGAAAVLPPTATESRPAGAAAWRPAAREATRLSEEDRPLAGWLVVMRSPYLTAYRDVPLYRGRNMLGRDTWPEAQSDRSMSGQHALITANSDEAVITDISQNGTAVNNKPVMSHPLAGGDRIKLGKTVLVYVPFTDPQD